MTPIATSPFQTKHHQQVMENASTPDQNSNDALKQIWLIKDNNEFTHELSSYIFDKSINHQKQISMIEQNIWDIAWIPTYIDGGGFCDLFYQKFNLADTVRLEKAMREMGLVRAADLFAEAIKIYCRDNSDITQEQYKNLEPFSLEPKQGELFDKIGKDFMDEMCKNSTSSYLRKYAIKNASEIG